jgi:hypothetical protein
MPLSFNALPSFTAGDITEELADKFKSNVYFAQRMIRVTRYGSWVCAFLCALAVSVLLWPRAAAASNDENDASHKQYQTLPASSSHHHMDSKHIEQHHNTSVAGINSSQRELSNPASA